MTWLATYAGYGLPRAELFAQLRADEWRWSPPSGGFAAVYPEGSRCPFPRATHGLAWVAA